MTRREEIEEMLRSNWISVQELAYWYRVPMGEIREDMEHVFRSNRPHLEMQPPACKVCGFSFPGRERVKTPSKCPSCRHERITPPKFTITN